MDRLTGAALRAAVLVGAALAAAAPPASAVTLQATTATVSNAGDTGQICVFLETGGQQVAGTQNDLVWDGNCASLPDPGNCRVAGSHGKDLKRDLLRGADFTLRALVLSLSDTDPIDDGVLYCCGFISEAEPGRCCKIDVVNVGSSDPIGKALSTHGSAGSICTASSGGGPARGGVAPGPDRPESVVVPAPAAPSGEAAAPAPAAQPGGVARAPITVLEGGGPQVEAPADVPAIPGAALLPTVVAGATAAAAIPTPVQPPVPPAAAAATREPTTAPTTAPSPLLSVGSPTSKPTARRTTAPTAAGKAAAAEEKTSGGWFGCQVGGGTGASAAMGLTLCVALATAIRRARRRTPPATRTQPRR